MWLLIVVDKCVLLTANFVGFYFVKMSNFVTFFLMKKGVYNPILVLTYWKLKVIITKKKWSMTISTSAINDQFCSISFTEINTATYMFQGKMRFTKETLKYHNRVWSQYAELSSNLILKLHRSGLKFYLLALEYII